MTDYYDNHAVDKAAIRLATEIYQRAADMDEANQLFTRAWMTLQTTVHLGLSSPSFAQRADAKRQSEAAQAAKVRDERMLAQLSEFGIDPAPIFSDRPTGSD